MQDIKDLDLQNINSVDLEIDPSLLDDDDSFGNVVTDSKPNTFDGEEINCVDNRPVKKVTGIKIDLSDDDSEISFKSRKQIPLDDIPTLTSKSINCTSEQDIMDAVNDTNTERGMASHFNDDFNGINSIDMECSVGEDDDFVPRASYVDEDDVSPELVSEEMIQEKKKKERVSQGKVESDYWERLAKKHKETNVKGAHNIHAHYGGDPKLAMDLLNHDLTPNGKIPTITDGVPAATVSDGAAYTSDISSGEMGASDGGTCCGESKEKDNNRQLFENLLIITGFELQPKEDNKFIVKDLYGLDSDMECKDEKDCINKLRPYIDDTFIIPLQIQTGEQFKEPEEWVNWYDDEKCKQFPKCKSDIDYCKMLADYLKVGE